MVNIVPFRALRYKSETKQADISNFICPPYDVISPKEREEIVKKGPENIVQLELPEGEGDTKYDHAAQLLQKWLKREVLQQDRRPSLYLIETTYRIADPFAPNEVLKRYGVMTALRLEAPGKGGVKPHEKTLPKAKEDRLKLIKAVQTNISPIFGLFFDKKSEWKDWLKKILKEEPICQGTEKKDLTHRMWKITDEGMIEQLQKILKSRELYIADGHHRYEVAWAYRDSLMKEGLPEEDPDGWKFVMAYVCPMEEQGLLMLPTHRLVKTTKSLRDWRAHLESVFHIEPVKTVADVIGALSKPSGKRTIGWITSEGPSLMTLKKEISIDRCMAHRSVALRSLDVVLLHDLALGEAQGVDFLKEKEVEYTRDVVEIERRTKADSSWVAFILGSPGVESLARVAEAGEVMPPKTTYFYPKVPTGFTLMPVDKKIP